MDEWEVSRTATYEIEANWKLVAENFMEYYHLPWVHPGLVKVSPMNAHYRWQGPGTYVGFCTTPIASNADEGGWQGLPAISGLNDVDAVSARFVVLFPNVALSVLPNHVFMMIMHPTSAGHTSEQTFLLTNPESLDDAGSEAAIDELLQFWDSVNREDVDIVEVVQRGMANTSYTGGRMCYRFEESVHRFQNLVIDRMLGVDRIPEGDDGRAGPDVRARGRLELSPRSHEVARNRRLEAALVHQLVAVPGAQLGRQVKRAGIGAHRGAGVDAGAPVAAPDRDLPLRRCLARERIVLERVRSGRCLRSPYSSPSGSRKPPK